MGKSDRVNREWQSRLLAVAAASCLGGGVAHAYPTGPAVAQGQAGFSTSGNTLTITNSPGSVINWQSFSIGSSEITRFIQQSSASAVLNRVIGANPSAILGALQSNGRVFLINPSGITFGPNAQIDVAGLVASTLNLSDADFLAGRYRFTETPGAGGIVNQGSITTTSGGMVYLVAPDIQNTGIIKTPQGEILLAAGKSVELVDAQTPEVRVQISAPDNQALNLGQLIAEGGRIGVYAGLIRHGGVANANAAVMGENGKIVFKAVKDVTLEAGSQTIANGPQGGGVAVRSETGTTLVSGTVEAKGTEGKGGTVRILGKQVGLIDNATIDASGQTGGGTVLIGGDYQGKNPDVQNALRTYVGKDVTIKADAVTSGDGGKVVVWADDATRYYGSVSARGGAVAGDGGFVEVSGKKVLDFSGTVDTRAFSGETGLLLLDPTNIFIAVDQTSATAAGMDGTDTSANTGTGVDPTTFAATGAVRDSVLTTGRLQTALDTSRVLVTTENASGTGVGNITVVDTITAPTGTNGLTLRADNNIILSATGNIDFAANSNTGNVALAALVGAITTSGGAIKMGGGSVLLKAGTGIGTSSSPILTNGLADFAAQTGTGGIFVRNSGSGNINITSVTNTDLGPLTINGVSTTSAGAGDIVIENQVSGGTIMVLQAVSTAGNTNGSTGSVSLNTGATGGSVTVNANVTTGDTSQNDADGTNETPASGSIIITAGTSVTGTGKLQTGAATLTGADAAGTDSVTSGNISVTSGTAGTSGEIALSNANALVIGVASRTTGTGTDATNAGAITLTSDQKIYNGTGTDALALTISTATGGATNNQGLLNITTNEDAGSAYITSGSALRVGTLDTKDTTSQTLSIATTAGNLTLAAGAAYALDTDVVTLTPAGAFTLSQDITSVGSFSVSGGTAITISNPITTAAVTAAGTATSGGITLSGSGTVALNAALTTGAATATDAAADTATSGSISVTSTASTITGDASGKLKTGVATADGGTTADTATSGTITLSASGAIQLAAADALEIGNATVTTAGAGNAATTGNITVATAEKLSADATNGKVDVRFGTPTATAATVGKLNVTTTGSTAGTADNDGGIFVTSGENLVVGTLNTADGTSENIAIATTANAALTLAGGGADYALDTDALTVGGAGTGVLTISEDLNTVGSFAGTGNSVVVSNAITTTGGSVTLTAGTTIDSSASGTITTTGAVGSPTGVNGGEVFLYSTGTGAITLLGNIVANGGNGAGAGDAAGNGGLVTIRNDIGAIMVDDITTRAGTPGAGGAAGTDGTIQLQASTTIGQQSGTALAAGNLKLKTVGGAGGVVTLNNNTNDVSVLAANLTTGSSLNYRDSNALTVGSVTVDGTGNASLGTVTGISTSNQNVTVTADTGTLTVSNAISSGTGAVSLTNTAGAVALNNSITTSGGTVTLTASTTIDSNANGTITTTGETGNPGTAGGEVLLRSTGAGAITLNSGITASGGAGGATGQSGGAGGVVTVLNDNGAITVHNITTRGGASGGGAGVAGADGTIQLSATGAMGQQGSTSLQAGSLKLIDTGGVVLLTNSGNDVATLAANLSGASSLNYTDTNALTIGQITTNGALSGANLGTVTGITTANRDATLNTGNTLTVSQNINTGTGTLTLNPGAGGVTATAASITATNLLLTGAGTFTLTNVGNDVGTLAANVAGSINYADSNALMIGTVGATSGITTTANGAVTVSSGNTLTIAAAGDINADGAVSLTGGSGISTAGDVTTTNDNITFNSPTTLTGSIALDTGTGAGNIVFANTLTGTTAGSESLTLTAGSGNVDLQGTVGATALSSLTVNSATTARFSGNVTTTGAQNVTAGTIQANATHQTTNSDITFTGSLVLQNNTALNTGTGAGNISVTGTTDATTAGGQSLTLTAGTGNTDLRGAVGTTALSSLGVNSAATARFGANVTTTGAQSVTAGTIQTNATHQTTNSDITFTGNLVLQNNTLLSTGSGGITVTGTTDGGFSLTANSAGITTLAGAVGSATSLASLTTDTAGSTRVSGGSVRTTGNQTYNDAVTLNANTTLTSTASGDVTFASTLNSFNATARNLTVNTGGITTFATTVGETNALAGLTTDASGTTRINGGSVVTTGAQTYGDAVTLGADTTFTGDDVSFNNTLNSSGTNRTLTVNDSGTTTFGGVVGGTLALTSIATDAPGTTAINATDITTTGTQTYNDAVTVGADTALHAGSANVLFSSTVAGAAGLTVNTAGATTFSAAVGSVTPLASLATNAGGTTSLRDVTTTGAQSYGDNVVLNSTYTTSNGAFSVAGTTTLAGASTTIDTGSGDITFTGAIDGANNLTLTNTGTTTFSSPVGGTTPLTTLTATAGNFAMPASVTTTGDITMTGAGSYSVPDIATTSGGNIALTSTGGTLSVNAAKAAAGGNVTFTADEIELTGAANSIIGSANLRLQPHTAGQAIEIGGAGGTSALDITNSEITRIATGFSNITIGRAAGTGIATFNTSSFNDHVTVVGGSIAANGALTAAGKTVTLIANSEGISSTGGGANVIADTLDASAAGNIALNTQVNTINAASSGGSIALVEADGATLAGISAPAGDVDITATTGNLTLGTVTAGTTNNKFAMLFAPAGTITDSNGSAVNVTAANIELVARDGIDLDTRAFNSDFNTVNFPTLQSTRLNAGTITAVNTGIADIDIRQVGNADILNVATASDQNTSGNITISGTDNLSVNTVTAGGLVYFGPSPSITTNSVGGNMLITLNSPRASAGLSDPTVTLGGGSVVPVSDTGRDGGPGKVAVIERFVASSGAVDYQVTGSGTGDNRFTLVMAGQVPVVGGTIKITAPGVITDYTGLPPDTAGVINVANFIGQTIQVPGYASSLAYELLAEGSGLEGFTPEQTLPDSVAQLVRQIASSQRSTQEKEEKKEKEAAGQQVCR